MPQASNNRAHGLECFPNDQTSTEDRCEKGSPSQQSRCPWSCAGRVSLYGAAASHIITTGQPPGSCVPAPVATRAREARICRVLAAHMSIRLSPSRMTVRDRTDAFAHDFRRGPSSRPATASHVTDSRTSQPAFPDDPGIGEAFAFDRCGMDDERLAGNHQRCGVRAYLLGNGFA